MPAQGCAPAGASRSVRRYCEAGWPTFKIPRYVHVVEEFPMTVTGKIRKVEMRETAARCWTSPPDGGPPPDGRSGVPYRSRSRSR